MQKIKFTTAAGSIEITDYNLSKIDGEAVRLHLNEFDANSTKMNVQAIKGIDMPGQAVLSSVPNVKTIVAKIAFAPIYMQNNRAVCTGTAGAQRLSREIMKYFPLGESGILEYTNANGTFEITARLDETPKITIKDGWYCECSLFLTADYPYWSRNITMPAVTASPNVPAHIVPTEYGDISSPVSGLITCISDMSALAPGYVTAFWLKESNRPFHVIEFTKEMKAGDQLRFSLEYNNRFTVEYKLAGSSSFTRASGYLYLTEFNVPCRNVPPNGEFDFEVLTSSGELQLELTLNNLYTFV